MAIAKIMTRNLITVSPDDTIEKMEKILNKLPIHHLLVVENNQLLGVVSDRDVLKVLSPYLNTKVQTEKDLFTLTRKAHQIMSRELITIRPSATIQEAARCLIDNNVSLLPVTNEEGEPVGVLSWKDVMRFIVD